MPITEQQKKAKFGSFLSAGYAAYYAAYFDINSKRVVPILNPYREAPFRDLWAKGWRDAEREHKRHVPFRSVGYIDDRTYDDRRQKFFKPKFTPKHKQPRGFVSQVGKGEAKIVLGAQTGRVTSTRPNVSNEPKDGVNLKRLDRFNNKFRTKV